MAASALALQRYRRRRSTKGSEVAPTSYRYLGGYPAK